MYNRLRVVIPGAPIPWARPRPRRQGGFSNTTRSQGHREKIAWLLRSAAAQAGWQAGGPVHLTVQCFFRRQKSGPSPITPGYRTERPDLDNLVKLVLEALQDAHVVLDDSQVVDLQASKRWADDGYTVVEVERCL